MEFIERQAKADKPFFAYIPYTLTHYPVLPSKAFDGKSGNGVWGDVLMQIDHNTGLLLDKLDELGIADNTIFIFTADNGAEMNPGYQGWAGPWNGTYFTAREGSLRVPFIMRWPGKVPADWVSNQVVHQMDLFPTFARIAGGKVPTDRMIDGVDQSDFFFRKQERSNRDGFVIYVGNDLFGSKWRSYKVLIKQISGGAGYGEREWGYGNVVNGLAFYDLYLDPKEQYPWTKDTPHKFWMRFKLFELIDEHLKSLQAEPPIKPGTPDPYIPQKK
jgi:arylsulfatase